MDLIGLGDSGYALDKYMLILVLNAFPGSPEERYTARHCQVRNRIERLWRFKNTVEMFTERPYVLKNIQNLNNKYQLEHKLILPRNN
ncbi:hypothetical protein NQ315_014641 [Exocentrus adspersus]|uniref:Uncharacterized protein n=1 Tax=Exocentrus adspersus TaxID=1586481 RepID=A0AAV8VPY3_9CUCU|nr:hypothetical protein NQ315_014641 [Exocentrus adspersus]